MHVQPEKQSNPILDMHILRDKLQSIERLHSQQSKPWICPTGVDVVDLDLPEKGLSSHAVHALNGYAALSFLLRMLKNLPDQQNIFWCRSAKANEVPYGPAFLQYGINPETILFVQCHGMKDLLWAYEEALKSNAVNMVIAEPEAPINLTESRRLQLAAEIGGALGILLSSNPDHVSAANALFSRWHIAPLPSNQADDSYHVELQRMRGHAPRIWQVEIPAYD